MMMSLNQTSLVDSRDSFSLLPPLTLEVPSKCFAAALFHWLHSGDGVWEIALNKTQAGLVSTSSFQ